MSVFNLHSKVIGHHRARDPVLWPVVLLQVSPSYVRAVFAGKLVMLSAFAQIIVNQ
ncbi:MAG TPA: hypothetical protein VF988_16240 [Verrucomicrobiae bacterium]